MTQAQKSLYNLLTRTNKLSKDAGEPYIAQPKEAFTSIVENIDDETAQGIVRDNRAKTLMPGPAEGETDKAADEVADEAGQIETLLWIVYIRAGGAHGNMGEWGEAVESWIRFRKILKDFIQQREKFVKVAQNRETNALAALFNKNLQTDIFGNATATAKGVEFKIERYKDVGDLRTQTIMLLDAMLAECSKTGTPSIQLPLRDYATLRGKTKGSKDQLKELRQEVVKDLSLLKNLSWRCRERIGGKWTDSGFIGICGGTSFIRGGIIYFNFNQDLYPSLIRYAPADYPKELWTADPRTSAYQFGRCIAQNYRLNEGKTRQNTVTVNQLLLSTDKIPTIEDVKKKKQSPKERIIDRFFRDLDSIDSVYYDVIDEQGQPVEDPQNLDYQTFIKCSLVFDYSDYPEHGDRVNRRKKRAEKIAKTQKRGGDSGAKGGG